MEVASSFLGTSQGREGLWEFESCWVSIVQEFSSLASVCRISPDLPGEVSAVLLGDSLRRGERPLGI